RLALDTRAPIPGPWRLPRKGGCSASPTPASAPTRVHFLHRWHRRRASRSRHGRLTGNSPAHRRFLCAPAIRLLPATRLVTSDSPTLGVPAHAPDPALHAPATDHPVPTAAEG